MAFDTWKLQMKVPVHKIVGDICMAYKDGERLQGKFREAFDRGDTVELDFDKMRIFATAFFNAAVASLLENYSRDELERRLKIVNLPPAAKELLDDSLDNADRSYHDPNFREALDRFWRISPPRPREHAMANGSRG
jgi:hypothetical protein